MAVFGRLFGEAVGVSEIRALQTPAALVDVVRSRVPRVGAATEEAPIFEAAAYVGEWLRTRAEARWISEGPLEPHLQITDASHAIVYLLPLVAIIRTASTAGYDGLAELLEQVLREVGSPARPGPLDELPVDPEADRADVVAWVRRNRDPRLWPRDDHDDTSDHSAATRAALWRRCSACATMDEQILTIHRPGDDWEGEAATAASILSRYPFACACGGRPGEVTRFLMLRHHAGRARLGDIYVASSHTRVGCWTLLDHDAIEPFDALALAQDEMR